GISRVVLAAGCGLSLDLCLPHATRPDEGRRDGVDANAVRRQILRGRLGQPDHRRLRGGVGRHVRRPGDAGHRSDVDDRTAGHRPGGGSKNGHYPEHVDLEDAPCILERVAVDRGEDALVAGVVHEPAERAQPFDCSRDGGLVRDVEGHALGAESAAELVQLRTGIRMIGQGKPVPPLRKHFGDRRSDVARCAGDEDGRHSVTLFRLTSAVSKRWTLPRSPTRTLSSGDPANGAAAFATIRRSSPSCSITRWTNASEPRSSTMRIRPATEPPSPTTTVSGRKPTVARSPPRSSATPISTPPIRSGPLADTGSMFIAGEPMNPATNRFEGSWYRADGVSTCCRSPSRSTATRCPIVLASTWSCVT